MQTARSMTDLIEHVVWVNIAMRKIKTASITYISPASYLCNQPGQQQEWQVCPCSCQFGLEHSPWKCLWACGWVEGQDSPPNQSYHRKGRAVDSGRMTGCSRTAPDGHNCHNSLYSQKNLGLQVYLQGKKKMKFTFNQWLRCLHKEEEKGPGHK